MSIVQSTQRYTGLGRRCRVRERAALYCRDTYLKRNRTESENMRPSEPLLTPSNLLGGSSSSPRQFGPLSGVPVFVRLSIPCAQGSVDSFWPPSTRPSCQTCSNPPVESSGFFVVKIETRESRRVRRHVKYVLLKVGRREGGAGRSASGRLSKIDQFSKCLPHRGK